MNMNTKKNASSPAAIAFYVVSVILLIVFAFNIYYSYTYVASFNVAFSDEWKTILSIYSQQCTTPFVGALVAYGIGYIINKLQATQNTLAACIEDAMDNKEEESLDDLKKEPEVKEEPKEEKKKAEPKKKKAEPKKKEIKDEKVEELKAEEPKAEESKEETKSEDVKTEETKA